MRWRKKESNLICMRPACWRWMWRGSKPGLLLIEVGLYEFKEGADSIAKIFAVRVGLRKMVHLEKENFIGKRALELDAKNGVARQLVGVEVDWTDVEALYERYGLTPAAPSQASRVAVPLYSGDNRSAKLRLRVGRRS